MSSQFSLPKSATSFPLLLVDAAAKLLRTQLLPANASNNLTRPPVIGITTFDQNEKGHYHLASANVEAVRLAGGLPVLLPPDEPNPGAILDVVDGLIFSGGGDLDPATYNGSMHPSISQVDLERDTFELKLARLALNTDIPVLGICRGIGVLSVASGGTLVPHIPDKFGKVVAHVGGRTQKTVKHQVQIEPHSHLAEVMQATVATVVSWHHQAVSCVPPGWRITAHASDGVIEAIEHEQHPWAIALQWHPELALDDPLQQRIFQSLIEAARTRSIRKPIQGLSRSVSKLPGYASMKQQTISASKQ